jgi:hypothetical protein
MNRLEEILSTMNLPQTRRDTTHYQNVRWLQRNMAIANSHHPDFKEAKELLRRELLRHYGG